MILTGLILLVLFLLFSKQWIKNNFMFQFYTVPGWEEIAFKDSYNWEKCSKDSALSEATIKRWFADLKRGAERSVRPNEAETPENIFKKIHKIVLNDGKVKLPELADILKISNERVGFLLDDHSDYEKALFKDAAKTCGGFGVVLAKLSSVGQAAVAKRNKSEFLHRNATMNETCIHHFIPESKRSSSEGRGTSSKAPESIAIGWKDHGLGIFGDVRGII